MNLPPIPTDNGSHAMRWARAVHMRVFRALRMVAGPGIRIQDTPDGQIITALATTKVSGSGTLNYKGTYDATKTYNKGDIVRVQTGNSQGIWICVSDTALTNIPPVFPEPATLTPPQTNNWELFALGVVATPACSNGSKIVYVNATPPLTLPV